MDWKSRVRAVARPVVRPVWRRIWPRINAQIEARVAPLEASFNQHVPALLNATTSVAAFGRRLHTQSQELQDSTDEMVRAQRRLDESARRINSHGEEIGKLWHRLEFVRNEIMYELQYGRRTVDATETNMRTEPRIVSTDKLEAAKAGDGIRLNLGCGHIPLDGYLNVDQRELPGVDVIADAHDLPFEPGSLAEITSAHMLEHFPQEALRRMLRYWRALLRRGGRFGAIVPDGEAMLAQLAAGEYPFEDFREVLFGGQEYNGDFHFNMFTPASLTALLAEAGFTDIEVPVSGRRNGKCFEFEIHARA